MVKPGFFCYLAGEYPLPFLENMNILRSVIGIFYWRYPAAIPGSIRAVIVDPIQLIPRWSVPHIQHKLPELQPVSANLNSPAAIPLPIL
jgi:hypothetical protein